jgi:hypothetical protein
MKCNPIKNIGSYAHMESNPYTPPRAPLADVANDSVTANRAVLTACKLLWVSFGLGLVVTASNVLRQSPLLISSLIGDAIGFAITWWMVSKLKARRNWMRLLMTILTPLGYLSVALLWKFYFPIYARNPIMAGVAALQIIPNICAVVLLNLKRSRAWFAATTRREHGA